MSCSYERQAERQYTRRLEGAWERHAIRRESRMPERSVDRSAGRSTATGLFLVVPATARNAPPVPTETNCYLS